MKHISGFRFQVSRFTFSILLPALVLLATAWSYAPQADAVTVTGQVTNGTPGGGVPADLPVTLQVIAEGGATTVYTATLGADGAFRFDDVDLAAGDSVAAQVAYQDVVYVSAPLTFEAGQTEISLPVAIYETTEDPAAIEIAQLHIFIISMEGALQVGEYYLIGNAGERTYVGRMDAQAGRRTTLSFTIPQQASGLSLEEPSPGERFVEQDGGFADTAPILPGDATVEVLFRYGLPYQEGLQVERTFAAPVASAAMIIADERLGLEGAGLTPMGTVETQMGPALSYVTGPLDAGEPLTFTLVRRTAAMPGAMPPSGSTGPAGTTPARNASAGLGIGLLALAAAVVAAFMLYRSPAAGPPPEPARPLLRSIAQLDADFEAGRIAEEAYRQKREALKRQVRKILTG